MELSGVLDPTLSLYSIDADRRTPSWTCPVRPSFARPSTPRLRRWCRCLSGNCTTWFVGHLSLLSVGPDVCTVAGVSPVPKIRVLEPTVRRAPHRCPARTSHKAVPCQTVTPGARLNTSRRRPWGILRPVGVGRRRPQLRELRSQTRDPRIDGGTERLVERTFGTTMPSQRKDLVGEELAVRGDDWETLGG